MNGSIIFLQDSIENLQLSTVTSLGYQTNLKNLDMEIYICYMSYILEIFS